MMRMAAVLVCAGLIVDGSLRAGTNDLTGTWIAQADESTNGNTNRFALQIHYMQFNTNGAFNEWISRGGVTNSAAAPTRSYAVEGSEILVIGEGYTNRIAYELIDDRLVLTRRVPVGKSFAVAKKTYQRKSAAGGSTNLTNGAADK